jgi:hypothetical protein
VGKAVTIMEGKGSKGMKKMKMIAGTGTPLLTPSRATLADSQGSQSA